MIDDEKIKIFLERRSIRSYDSKLIEDDVLTNILEAGRWTFNAMNKQPCTFYALRNKELIKKIGAECLSGPYAATAPALIVLVGDTEVQPDWYIQDLSFAAKQIALAAWAYGVGTCCIAGFNRVNVKKLLGLKEKDYILTILPLGYPKGKIPKAPPRKPLDEIAVYIN